LKTGSAILLIYYSGTMKTTDLFRGFLFVQICKISLTKRAGHRKRRFFPLDFQNSLRHPHRDQHMEYRHGHI